MDPVLPVIANALPGIIRVRLEGHFARLMAPRRPKESHPGFVIVGGSPDSRLLMREHTPWAAVREYDVMDRGDGELFLNPGAEVPEPTLPPPAINTA